MIMLNESSATFPTHEVDVDNFNLDIYNADVAILTCFLFFGSLLFWFMCVFSRRLFRFSLIDMASSCTCNLIFSVLLNFGCFKLMNTNCCC